MQKNIDLWPRIQWNDVLLLLKVNIKKMVQMCRVVYRMFVTKKPVVETALNVFQVEFVAG